MPIDHLGRRTISPTSNRYNKLFQKSTLNLTLLVLLVWGVYLNTAHRQTISQSNQEHVITTNYSVVKYVGNVSHVPTNDCLVQLGHVRDIKLYSQNDEDGALLQLLRCSKYICISCLFIYRIHNDRLTTHAQYQWEDTELKNTLSLDQKVAWR